MTWTADQKRWAAMRRAQRQWNWGYLNVNTLPKVNRMDCKTKGLMYSAIDGSKSMCRHVLVGGGCGAPDSLACPAKTFNAVAFEDKGTGFTSIRKDETYTNAVYDIDGINSAMICFLATLDNERDDEWWGTEQEVAKRFLQQFKEFIVNGQSVA